MQSFGAPRPTSNPYVHMLDDALAATPGVEHVRFDRRQALFGRLDAIQFHWPETLFGAGTGAKALARRAFAVALRARISLGRVAIIRTVHNVELPNDVAPWQRRYLEWVERRTDHRIVLNDLTELPEGAESTLIPHGHYREWFADVEKTDAAPGTLGFVGLVRRYKGVEDLIRVFRDTADVAPDLRLHIAGNPTSAGIADEVRESAKADGRIELDLRYLSEPDFARAVMGSSGIVLPYRFMHNSGTVLAALSLNRPVLVPRTAVNDALSAEVGRGWITMFDDELADSDLLAFAEAIRTLPEGEPDLSARDWDRAGVAHRDAFRRAIAHRRAGAR
ncbi:GDP-mannose:glycolipid 4-beta-D-mannosyltransferase [Microbacterium foliorum]|uniref:GDP-mannose:glycolipid 4-beta-D-mannosyltransferase n=2 Tax=Microbacterium foliorum TaxID=104336 RepID=A0A0F0KFV5_9MICO|nr:GDP-mannose:glycolipid 4-beta-D-mannosyltransferase precursor [Microbacterium foliorum]CAH0229636.1 GDP-mannose:glycolipid 4-beta-D-mannosyltransferase [Microbacterium foliorum]CAH0245168.1 GDP-mannose:glycolipid 4-beta-D-mannosyltransferase [Microbacterium foliorum]